LTRSRIFALAIAPVVLALALSACGGSSSDDPQAIVDEATLQGVESGNLDLSVGVGVRGKKSGLVRVAVSGTFQKEEEAELPELDITASAKGSVGGKKVDFDGGLTLLDEKAFVGYEGTEYAVDPSTYDYVRSLAKEPGGEGKASSSEVTACQDAAAELNVADFVENPRNEGSVEVGGTSTTKVSGDLNGPDATDALSELLEDPACSEQLEATGAVPSAAELDEAKSTVRESLKSAHIELFVGDDHIIRRIEATAKVEPAKEGEIGAERVALRIDLTLTGVNEEQTISAPKKTKPLSDLFLKLGVNPLELLGQLQGGGGASGLGDLLESLSKIGAGGSGGGSGGSGGGSGGGGQQAYYECLGEAHTAVDIQRCEGLLQ
jgi:hypothetical protein